MKSSLQRHILKKHPDEYKSVAGQLYPEKKVRKLNDKFVFILSQWICLDSA